MLSCFFSPNSSHTEVEFTRPSRIDSQNGNSPLPGQSGLQSDRHTRSSFEAGTLHTALRSASRPPDVKAGLFFNLTGETQFRRAVESAIQLRTELARYARAQGDAVAAQEHENVGQAMGAFTHAGAAKGFGILITGSQFSSIFERHAIEFVRENQRHFCDMAGPEAVERSFLFSKKSAIRSEIRTIYGLTLASAIPFAGIVTAGALMRMQVVRINLIVASRKLGFVADAAHAGVE